MTVLGISAFVHDSAACLIIDGRIVASVEEERLNRVKHTNVFPEKAIAFVLGEAGIGMNAVDTIAFNWKPGRSLLSEILKLLMLPVLYFKALRYNKPPKNFGSIAATFGLRRAIEKRYPGQFKGRIEWVEHHRAHAASSYFLSGKSNEPAIALIVDGHGEDCATSLFELRGREFRKLRSWAIFDSLGILYTNFTRFLGFGDFQEGKTMALAAFGKDSFAETFARVLPVSEDGGYRLANKRYLGLWNYFEPKLAPELGRHRKPGEPLEQRHYDIAHSMQARIGKVILHLLRSLPKDGPKNLCLAGGVFLNCDINSDIVREKRWERVFVPPFTSDSGGAIGAALYAACVTAGDPAPSDFSPYMGPGYSDEQIGGALEDRRMSGKRTRETPELLAAAAARLHEGACIGWFQGRVENGPRALGNRSILANPSTPGIQAYLNTKIKQREGFRPFAPIATPEAALRFFQLEEPVPSLSRYMLMTVQVRPEYRERLAGITHVDGSARIQIVDEETNPILFALLKTFGRLSGFEVLLNTSFNRQEPIVCSPGDAIDCFVKSELDALYAGSFELLREWTTQAKTRTAPAAESLSI